MTRTESSPVRLHTHWRDPIRVEADDARTAARAAGVLTVAGYRLAEPPHDAVASGDAFWFDEFDPLTLQQMLVRNGIPAVIASTTLPTPAEAAADEAAWQAELALMEVEAQAAVEAEARRPAPADGAPF